MELCPHKRYGAFSGSLQAGYIGTDRFARGGYVTEPTQLPTNARPTKAKPFANKILF